MDDSQKRYGLALILVACLAAMFLYPSFFSSLTSHLSVSNGGTSVTGSPTLSAFQVNNILCASHSPACGSGQAFYDGAIHYQINDAYALATFHHESSYGLAGVARTSKAIGNIRCTTGYACYSGYRSYSSWGASINDFYSLIRGLYINDWHLSTVEAIIPKYAPSTDHNDPASYIVAVVSDINSYK